MIHVPELLLDGNIYRTPPIHLKGKTHGFPAEQSESWDDFPSDFLGDHHPFGFWVIPNSEIFQRLDHG